MISLKCIYFKLLIVHWSYQAPTIIELHTNLHILFSTDGNPKFVDINDESVKQPAQINSASAGNSSSENSVSTNSVKDLSTTDATLPKQGDDTMYLSSEDLSSDSTILTSISKLQRIVRETVNKNNDYDKDCSNTLLDWQEGEFHIPCYQYCGPGTNYKERLRNGKKGINALDAACKQHDMVYDATTDINQRQKADKVLIAAAQKIHDAEETSLDEWLMSGAVIDGITVKNSVENTPLLGSMLELFS